MRLLASEFPVRSHTDGSKHRLGSQLSGDLATISGILMANAHTARLAQEHDRVQSIKSFLVEFLKVPDPYEGRGQRLTVGTAHITPPLPKIRNGRPCEGHFYFRYRDQDSVLGEKQIQPSGGDASRREIAVRQRECSERSILSGPEGAKANPALLSGGAVDLGSLRRNSEHRINMRKRY
jgi:hypothetical protein